MRLTAHGRSAQFWGGSKRLFARRMTADERSLAICACRSCGGEIKSGLVYCLPCATTHADHDAGHFDRWLAVYTITAVGMIALYSAYLAAKYIGIFS